MLAVEACVVAYARKAGEDEEKWGLRNAKLRTGRKVLFSAGLLPTYDESLADPRMSDVDEWGRSEHMREIARKAFDPMYRRWFRAEWEGLEKIPSDGGALLVSNHAAAIPSDAPVIMHGIETELGRPVYGLAEYIFRELPVVGTMWSRVGGVTAQPDNAYRLLREQKQAREMEQASAAITKYYDALTEQEMEEDRAWGKAAESQFPAED